MDRAREEGCELAKPTALHKDVQWRLGDKYQENTPDTFIITLYNWPSFFETVLLHCDTGYDNSHIDVLRLNPQLWGYKVRGQIPKVWYDLDCVYK